MTLTRSALFNLLFFAWTALVAIGGLPTLLLPGRSVRRLHTVWRHGVALLLDRVAGIGVRVEGWEAVPPGPVILAAKHQSAWDTIELPWRFTDAAVVVKRELMRIPVFGWYLRKGGMIAVDRAGRAPALRRLVRDAEAAVAEGRPVLIFPEGTRVAPGERRPYHPGVAALYQRLGVPVVPIALNSGCFWARRAFAKRPGTITVSILPTIPPGLGRHAFLAALEAAIETRTDDLVAAARSGLRRPTGDDEAVGGSVDNPDEPLAGKPGQPPRGL